MRNRHLYLHNYTSVLVSSFFKLLFFLLLFVYSAIGHISHTGKVSIECSIKIWEYIVIIIRHNDLQNGVVYSAVMVVNLLSLYSKLRNNDTIINIELKDIISNHTIGSCYGWFQCLILLVYSFCTFFLNLIYSACDIFFQDRENGKIFSLQDQINHKVLFYWYSLDCYY